MNDPEPPTAQAALERARAALAVGRYTDAVAGLRALADGGAATAREAGLLLGRSLRASGDAAGAIPVLQDVLNSTSATGDAEAPRGRFRNWHRFRTHWVPRTTPQRCSPRP